MNNKELILDLGIKAKKASNLLSHLSNEKKNLALKNLKENLKDSSNELIRINNKDIENGKVLKLSSSIMDRLTLTQDRIESMIKSLDEIINIKNPVGNIISEWSRPNGLKIKKISVPLGVIGINYEARPNVTVDASVS